MRELGSCREAAILPALVLAGLLSIAAIGLDGVNISVRQSQSAAAASAYQCGQGSVMMNDQCKHESYAVTYGCTYPQRKTTAPNKGAQCMKDKPCGGPVNGHKIVGHCDSGYCCHADTVDGEPIMGKPQLLQQFPGPVFNESTGVWEGQNVPTPYRVAPDDESIPLRPVPPLGMLGEGTVYSDSGAVVYPQEGTWQQYTMQQYSRPPSEGNIMGQESGNPIPGPLPPEYEPPATFGQWSMSNSAQQDAPSAMPVQPEPPSSLGEAASLEPLSRPALPGQPISKPAIQLHAESAFGGITSQAQPQVSPTWWQGFSNGVSNMLQSWVNGFFSKL